MSSGFVADLGKEAVHHAEVFFGLVERHDQRRADADDFAGERAEQVDGAAVVHRPGSRLRRRPWRLPRPNVLPTAAHSMPQTTPSPRMWATTGKLGQLAAGRAR